MERSSGLVNCTPHPLTVYRSDRKTPLHTYEKSEYSARLTQNFQDKLGGFTLLGGHTVPVVSPQEFNGIEGLPKDKTMNIIVSMVVGQYMKDRGVEWEGRVVEPDTGPSGAVRGEKGVIMGTTQLIEYCASKVYRQ